MADLHVPIRAGSDIAFLGALVNHVLSNDLDFREYVVAYTNAASIIEEVGMRLPGDGELPAVTVSIGAALSVDRGRELTNLLEAADTALYEAKEAGRARVAMAD